ncbi:MAG: RND transporter, partial [Burkholderiaceae bacterium]
LQKRISEEHLLHYNGMIIGVFELLKDAKHQTEAVEGYLRALSAYWQAEHALTPKIFALREQLAQTRRDAWK